ncbi:rRNA maturation RNase YbeY [Candidatus Uhrbacteria bacterium]|nr:rRNA maturation RNase YbeY [Candidatus Uhrbacteria bacterium]
MLTVTIYRNSSASRSRIYTNTVEHVLQMACRTVRCPKGMAVSVVFVGDKKMRELNRTYRSKDKTTNVLAFPMLKETRNLKLEIRKSTKVSSFQFPVSDLGDIFISLGEARREAKKYGWKLQYEIARLALHGFLHLLGYDHVEEEEARRMERIEEKILEPLANRV